MNKSEKFWDWTASNYDQQEKKDEHTTLKIIEKTKKYLKISDFVLDFGCGTGQISNEIAGSVNLIQAVDTSSQRIEIARKKAGGRKIENIDYAHATLFDDRYKVGSFDLVLAFYILHLVEEPHTVMQRINELLKPGGLMSSATPCMGEKIFLRISSSFISKTGLMPNIRTFKRSELVDSMANANFEILEMECLHQNSQQFFIAARKQ